MSGINKLIRSLTSSNETPIRALVKGQIPKWLNGTLYRNGPGRFKFGDKKYMHLFDGQACVHKFKIQNGQVFYSNKLLETKSYTKTLAENRLYPNFGTPDKKSNIIQRFKSLIKSETRDNVNVNVAPFANVHLYALTETNMFCRIDPNDLKILETINVTNYFPNLRSVIAHPHIDHEGNWITMGFNPRGKTNRPHYEFIRFKGGKVGAQSLHAFQQAEVKASVPSRHKFAYSYFHCFGVTENYIVFLEQCLIVTYKGLLLAIIQNKPFSTALKLDKNLPTKIIIINKHTGKIINQNFVTDPQFSFHYINSYENGKEIVLDLCTYDCEKFNVNLLSYENIPADSDGLKSKARRIRIPLDLSKQTNKEIYCSMEDINSDSSLEFPIINYKNYNGKAYKFVYGISKNNKLTTILKLNVENKNEIYEKKYEKEDKYFFPSEPIFVGNPNGSSEDDGVLLVMVLSDDKNDFLSILDAKNLDEIARADLPEDVKAAYTFHGFFADIQTFKDLN